MLVMSCLLIVSLLLIGCGSGATPSPSDAPAVGDQATKSPEPEIAARQADATPADPGPVESAAPDDPDSTKNELPTLLATPDAEESPVVPADEPASVSASPAEVTRKAPVIEGLSPLNPEETVLIDVARKRVFLKSRVVLREGVLEMFACRAGSKEHESIVSIDTQAYVIHAALLAVGAEPGTPVEFDPEYRPPQGQRIDIFVHWLDENGRPHREPVQNWVRHVTRRYYIEPLAALPQDLKLPEDGAMRYDAKRQELIWFGPMSESQRDELLALTPDAEFQTLVRKMSQDG
ncbi:MAG: hypothetical protein KF861_20555, partial [Planctomycetaceae bacterium]|nr:hypothetical protein [Planctomycetaceae bacterium]